MDDIADLVDNATFARTVRRVGEEAANRLLIAQLAREKEKTRRSLAQLAREKEKTRRFLALKATLEDFGRIEGSRLDEVRLLMADDDSSLEGVPDDAAELARNYRGRAERMYEMARRCQGWADSRYEMAIELGMVGCRNRAQDVAYHARLWEMRARVLRETAADVTLLALRLEVMAVEVEEEEEMVEVVVEDEEEMVEVVVEDEEEMVEPGGAGAEREQPAR
ncbi:hypothetical protein AK812_SmicGene33867, partial [Symbiodinium microadriaticum]